MTITKRKKNEDYIMTAIIIAFIITASLILNSIMTDRNDRLMNVCKSNIEQGTVYDCDKDTR